MHPWFRKAKAAVWLGCLSAAWPEPATADTTLIGAAEVAAGAGHDTNMFLSVRPDAAANDPRTQGWFGRLAPSLAGALSRPGWRSDVSYDLDLRRSSAGPLILQQAGWSVSSLVAERWQPRLAATLVGFSAPNRPEESFWSMGGEAGMRVDCSTVWRLLATYRVDRRSTDLSRRWLHQAEARVQARPGGLLMAGLAASGLRLSPDSSSSGPLRVARLGPDVTLVWNRFTARLGASVGVFDDSGTGMRDWQLGGAASVHAKLLPNVDATVWADWSRSVSGAADARYSRRVVLLGLIGHMAAKRAFRAPEPLDSLSPVVVGRRVRFRYPASDEKAVRVLGSWDDWRSPRSLASRGSGPWELWLELPPGSHRYRFWVDGRVVEPPEAPRYAEDDFGGRDGMVDVPAEGSQP